MSFIYNGSLNLHPQAINLHFAGYRVYFPRSLKLLKSEDEVIDMQTCCWVL